LLAVLPSGSPAYAPPVASTNRAWLGDRIIGTISGPIVRVGA